MSKVASASVVRQWARDNGLKVGDRGRLAPEVYVAFTAAAEGDEQEAVAASAEGIQPALPSRAVAALEVPLRISTQPRPGASGVSRTVSARKH